VLEGLTLLFFAASEYFEKKWKPNPDKPEK
jgi:hypothetical protein